MMLASPKGFSGMATFPRTLSSIAISVGGLALFLIFASLLLISHPIGSTVQGYIYGADLSRKLGLQLSEFRATNDIQVPKESPDSVREVEPINSSFSPNASEAKEEISQQIRASPFSSEPVTNSVPSNFPVDKGILKPIFPGFLSDSRSVDTGANDSTPDSSSNSKLESLPPSSPLLSNSSKVDSGNCDLYHGKWFYDSSGPLYTNNTCPILTQMQNCQGNGRPDKEYENWRWKPSQCDLPRFNATKFLELMRGKTLAFIVFVFAGRNLGLFIIGLFQVETPKNRGNRRMQRWYFKSTSVTIVRIWSSWLVHKTSEPFDFAPEGVAKLHLDAPDENFMSLLPSFDVLVLSSGHWFAKQSVYILHDEILGGQLWWPDKSHPKKIDNIKAFGISVETILTAIANHPNYTGLTIVRSYSPDHYEGGAWNTGGSCTGKVRPALDGELAANGFTGIMHEKQVMGFNRASKKARNGSKLRLMDITEAFGYRHDGHPGPYRNPDPNKITKRGPNGEPPPQDCLHWCMPGPVDTWNELVLEIIRREYEGTQSFPA
ncbi:hypothetical protein HHK36_004534 [Tetracentron sinense]|uniref:Trichome birefringence-like N-terminal domain-containing protein n=1 Tax=Tetracentron sinense TaxID=13715 RepID=A0A834ZUL3_TETSI|nr:hypothetical protein HHK36_004534 [Tetracentron sinense]